MYESLLGWRGHVEYMADDFTATLRWQIYNSAVKGTRWRETMEEMDRLMRELIRARVISDEFNCMP